MERLCFLSDSLEPHELPSFNAAKSCSQTSPNQTQIGKRGKKPFQANFGTNMRATVYVGTREVFYLENALHSCFDRDARVEGWIETSVG
jgi:hypothetical protein